MLEYKHFLTNLKYIIIAVSAVVKKILLIKLEMVVVVRYFHGSVTKEFMRKYELQILLHYFCQLSLNSK